ncbi:menaquinone biosynthetic enzyme MqnA/MqnD family protein [Deinococcus peraridilitoris]|uniref:menaquinone biosynthetic enzyme MqnA/MqnD family protein n=1 Tax=Deinococcus peraridilitoris TaxID=432329 RepID=UPI00030F6529|nr:menaquinone biosynthesis protein [Deinococcus peraridilitoris]
MTTELAVAGQTRLTPYRLGLIEYTNVAPLTENLALPAGVTLSQGVPSEMNAALLAGQVDLANISVLEFIRHADQFSALPDFSVSVLGAVYSVNLFHRRPWEELQGGRIALTSQSATSVGLLEVLLRESGLGAQLVRAEGEATALLNAGFDGVLRIGDSALREWYAVTGPIGEDLSMLALPHHKDGVTVTDLAQRWYQLTGHPFVFAVWAYRKDRPPPRELLLALRAARRAGLGRLGEISGRHAQKLGLPQRVVQHYLWNFRYHLEAPDRAGLLRFAQLHVPDHAPLIFE